jgi:hypothetical protein
LTRAGGSLMLRIPNSPVARTRSGTRSRTRLGSGARSGSGTRVEPGASTPFRCPTLRGGPAPG